MDSEETPSTRSPRIGSAIEDAARPESTSGQRRAFFTTREDCCKQYLSYFETSADSRRYRTPQTQLLPPQLSCEEDLDVPIAVRKSKRTIREPKRIPDLLAEAFQVPRRIRDLLPQSIHPVAPPANPFGEAALSSPEEGLANPNPSDNVAFNHRLRNVFRSTKNAFGLFRQYFGNKPPIHDPEESVTLSDLCEILPPTSHLALNNAGSSSTLPYYPYPNKSSFRLGEWYWNEGVQKSKESFKELVNIVGEPDFNCSDIRATK